MILKATLAAVVVAHYSLVIGTAFAVIPLIVIEPWYIALPIVLIITRILYTRDGVCPLNDLENLLRRKAGMPETEGFLKHYIYGRFSGKAT